MSKLVEIYQWLMANYEILFQFLALLGLAIEGFFRLWPTKEPTNVLEKAGKILRKIMDFLKIPNSKAKDSKFYIPTKIGLHDKDE